MQSKFSSLERLGVLKEKDRIEIAKIAAFKNPMQVIGLQEWFGVYNKRALFEISQLISPVDFQESFRQIHPSQEQMVETLKKLAQYDPVAVSVRMQGYGIVRFEDRFEIAKSAIERGKGRVSPWIKNYKIGCPQTLLRLAKIEMKTYGADGALECAHCYGITDIIGKLELLESSVMVSRGAVLIMSLEALFPKITLQNRSFPIVFSRCDRSLSEIGAFVKWSQFHMHLEALMPSHIRDAHFYLDFLQQIVDLKEILLCYTISLLFARQVLSGHLDVYAKSLKSLHKSLWLPALFFIPIFRTQEKIDLPWQGKVLKDDVKLNCVLRKMRTIYQNESFEAVLQTICKIKSFKEYFPVLLLSEAAHACEYWNRWVVALTHIENNPKFSLQMAIHFLEKMLSISIDENRYLKTFGSSRDPWGAFYYVSRHFKNIMMKEILSVFFRSVLDGSWPACKYENGVLFLSAEQKNIWMVNEKKRVRMTVSGYFSYKVSKGHFDFQKDLFAPFLSFLEGEQPKNADIYNQHLIDVVNGAIVNPVLFYGQVSNELFQDLQDLRVLQKSSLAFNYFLVEETDHWEDLLLCGTEITDSCLNIYKSSSFNKCLVAYLMDAKNRIIVVKDLQGRIVARAVLRLLQDEGNNPVLFLEKVYRNQGIPKEIFYVFEKTALDKAIALGIPLARDLHGGTFPLYSRFPTALYEYVDANNIGVVEGDFSIQAHIIYDPKNRSEDVDSESQKNHSDNAFS